MTAAQLSYVSGSRLTKRVSFSQDGSSAGRSDGDGSMGGEPGAGQLPYSNRRLATSGRGPGAMQGNNVKDNKTKSLDTLLSRVPSAWRKQVKERGDRIDVTELVRRMYAGGRRVFYADSDVYGDPAVGVRKILQIHCLAPGGSETSLASVEDEEPWFKLPPGVKIDSAYYGDPVAVHLPDKGKGRNTNTKQEACINVTANVQKQYDQGIVEFKASNAVYGNPPGLPRGFRKPTIKVGDIVKFTESEEQLRDALSLTEYTWDEEMRSFLGATKRVVDVLEDGNIVGFRGPEIDGSDQEEILPTHSGTPEDVLDIEFDLDREQRSQRLQQLALTGISSADRGPARSRRTAGEDSRGSRTSQSSGRPSAVFREFLGPLWESSLGGGSVWLFPASCVTLTTLHATKVVRASHGGFLSASPRGAITSYAVDPNGDDQKIVFVNAAEDEAVKTWTVVVEKTVVSALGLETDRAADGSRLRVAGVRPGLVQAWNEEHPDDAVAVDDLISSINGVTGDASAMLATALGDSRLELALERPRSDQVMLKTYHGDLINVNEDGTLTTEDDPSLPGLETVQFTLVPCEDGKILFRTCFGKYLEASPDGNVSASGENPLFERARFEVSGYTQRKLLVTFKGKRPGR